MFYYFNLADSFCNERKKKQNEQLPNKPHIIIILTTILALLPSLTVSNIKFHRLKREKIYTFHFNSFLRKKFHFGFVG